MSHTNSLLIIIIVIDHMALCHGTVLHDGQDYKRAKFRNEMMTDQIMVTEPMAIRTHPSKQYL
jgi:hypothetical protein